MWGYIFAVIRHRAFRMACIEGACGRPPSQHINGLSNTADHLELKSNGHHDTEGHESRACVLESTHCSWTALRFAWFQASAEKWMGSALFWVITQRVETIPYRRFGTTYRFQYTNIDIVKIRTDSCTTFQ